jgi:iron(III) transport system ATP-binding protein
MGLRIEDASHGYNGSDVVRGISLAVTAGEVVCLLGPSGCGKTTLLRLAAGLERLRRGRIIIGGRTVADSAEGVHAPPEKRRVGLMFQDYALFPHLTVTENIAFGLGGRPRDRRRWVRAALPRVGLAALADSYPHTLSGGEQQRCALLRALAPEPEVLLLDEPFSGLDVTLRGQVRAETLALLRETRVATLIVTHDPEEAMFMADRLLVMRDGAIVQQGTPAELYLQPRNPFVATLFGAANILHGVVHDRRVATPLGPVEPAPFADATSAIVLIRPEGLQRAADDGGAAAARVLAARLLGRASLLQLAVVGAPEVVQMLVPGVFLPAEGEVLRIVRDPHQTFVFPDA